MKENMLRKVPQGFGLDTIKSIHKNHFWQYPKGLKFMIKLYMIPAVYLIGKSVYNSFLGNGEKNIDM